MNSVVFRTLMFGLECSTNYSCTYMLSNDLLHNHADTHVIYCWDG